MDLRIIKKVLVEVINFPQDERSKLRIAMYKLVGKDGLIDTCPIFRLDIYFEENQITYFEVPFEEVYNSKTDNSTMEIDTTLFINTLYDDEDVKSYIVEGLRSDEYFTNNYPEFLI